MKVGKYNATDVFQMGLLGNQGKSLDGALIKKLRNHSIHIDI